MLEIYMACFISLLTHSILINLNLIQKSSSNYLVSGFNENDDNDGEKEADHKFG